MQIVTDNKNYQPQGHKGHLLKRKHLKKIIDYFFTKLFQHRKHKNNDKNVITFTITCNPNHPFSFKEFKNRLKNTGNRQLQKAFNDKKETSYYKKTKKIKKFECRKLKQSQKLTGLLLCNM